MEPVTHTKSSRDSSADRKASSARSLNADERASFIVLSIYLFIFFGCTYLFWDSVALQIGGGTAAIVGLIMAVMSFFNQGAGPRKPTRYTKRWYLLSFFSALVVLLLIRNAVQFVESFVALTALISISLVFLFVVYQKAMIQLLLILLAAVFVFVSVSNQSPIRSGHLNFLGTLKKTGQTIFKIQPIEEVTNLLIAGNYMGYLNKVDYRNTQINQVAVHTVIKSGDDDWLKTKAVLDFVSNDIKYISDPVDGFEYAKDPIETLMSGGGDCEDQTLLLCSMLESVGVHTYMAFTDNHVFALVQFGRKYPELTIPPHVYVEGRPCYALDPADEGATIGMSSATPVQINRVFDVRKKALISFTL